MTHYEGQSGKAVRGLTRGSDGILVWNGGARYITPKEAVKMQTSQGIVCVCNEAAYGFGYYGGPCGNRAKHDPDANGNPTKCGVHSKEGVEKRKAKQAAKDAERDAFWKKHNAYEAARQAVFDNMRAIAHGHNDPRALAKTTIAELERTHTEFMAARNKK